MERPLNVVVEGETAPGILLVSLIWTRECPVLQEQPIVKVRSLMSEAKERWTIVHGDKISQFKLHLNDWISYDDILVSSVLQINIHKRYLELLVIFVVVDDDLVPQRIHKVRSFKFVIDFSLCKNDLRFALSSVKLIFINNIFDLSYICFSRSYNLHKVGQLNICFQLVYRRKSVGNTLVSVRSSRNDFCDKFNSDELIQIWSRQRSLLFPWNNFLFVLNHESDGCLVLLTKNLFFVGIWVFFHRILSRSAQHRSWNQGLIYATDLAFTTNEWVYESKSKWGFES